MNLNLNNKKFVNAKNTSNGEVSHETIFNYLMELIKVVKH